MDLRAVISPAESAVEATTSDKSNIAITRLFERSILLLSVKNNVGLVRYDIKSRADESRLNERRKSEIEK